MTLPDALSRYHPQPGPEIPAFQDAIVVDPEL